MGAVSKLLKILIELKKPLLGVIENMTMADSTFIEEDVEKLQVRYLGRIPFDEHLEEAIGDTHRLKKTEAMKHLSAIIQRIGL